MTGGWKLAAAPYVGAAGPFTYPGVGGTAGRYPGAEVTAGAFPGAEVTAGTYPGAEYVGM